MSAYNTPPAGSMWIRDLVPNVTWDGATKTVKLPNGSVLNPNQYSLVDGKAYVNPNTVTSLMTPTYKPPTPDNLAPLVDTAKNIYQPQYNAALESLNRLITQLQGKADAGIQRVEASTENARTGLESREAGDLESLRNQAIARGTYTSGVSDYSNRRLREGYAPAYSNLEASNAASVSEVMASLGSALENIAAQGKDLEAGFAGNINKTALDMYNQGYDAETAAFNNLLKLVSSSTDRDNSLYERQTTTDQVAFNQAMQRTELAGKVTSAADAKLLGVPVGTPTAAMQLANRKSGGSPVDPFANLNKDLSIWEITGKAPDTAALRAYGIAPGTAWGNGSAAKSLQEQLSDAEAQMGLEAIAEEKTFNSSVKSLVNNLRVSEETAAAIVSLSASPSLEIAMAKLTQYEPDLRAEGADIAAIRKAIIAKWPSQNMIDPRPTVQPKFDINSLNHLNIK